jgi:hypothetical protein
MKQLLSFLRKGEDGQMLVFASLTIVVVIGFAALAVDIGIWMQQKAKLQADADAAALAGAWEVCGSTSCESAVMLQTTMYADMNLQPGSEVESISLTHDCNGNEENGYWAVTVTTKREQNTFLAGLLGITSATIRACATAGGGMQTAVGVGDGDGQGIRPFALDDRCFKSKNIQYNSQVVLKYDSSGKNNCSTNQGNFASILDANKYLDNIKYGSDDAVCLKEYETPTCKGTIPTLTGDKIGPTKQGIDWLMNNTPPSCDTWDEVQTDGDINPECAPWMAGYTGPGTRILLVPIVNGLWDGQGRTDVDILNFAIVFLEGYNGNCTGNNCQVKAKFIKVTANIPGLQWSDCQGECQGGVGDDVGGVTRYVSRLSQ